MNEIIDLLIIFIHLQRLQPINKHNLIALKLLFSYIIEQPIQSPLFPQDLIKHLLFLLGLPCLPLLHIHHAHITLLLLWHPYPNLEINNQFVFIRLLDIIIQGVFEQRVDGGGQ